MTKSAPYIRIRMSFIARYVYTYEDFVLVTEAPQCNRMTVTRQDTDNKMNNIQIYKIDNVQISTDTIYKNRQFCMYRYVMCKFEM